MGLYKAQLSVGPFKRGEIVDVDPAEWPRYIEKGWLKPHEEGQVLVAQPHPASGEPESTEDVSSDPDRTLDDASPSTDPES